MGVVGRKHCLTCIDHEGCKEKAIHGPENPFESVWYHKHHDEIIIQTGTLKSVEDELAMERDENEINSVVNFLTHEIRVRRYWLCPDLLHQAQTNLRRVLRTAYQSYRWDPLHPRKDAKHRKINMTQRKNEGTVAWRVKLALKPLGLHWGISKQLRIYVNPGTV